MRLRLRTLLVLPVTLATLAAPAAVAAPAAPIAGSCVAGNDWGLARQDLAGKVVELVNQYRAARGLSTLKVSPTLTKAALWKARHMAKYQYFGHADPAPPVARSTFDRIAACGYHGSYEGENIAYGYPTPSMVMQGWINSPGHRANLEQKMFNAIGVGVARDSKGVTYWVQDFGSQVDAGASASRPHKFRIRDDRRVTHRNRGIVLNVLKNDSGEGLRVTDVSMPSRHGYVWASLDGTVTYRPARNFVGRETFWYAALDANGRSAAARVTVRVKR